MYCSHGVVPLCRNRVKADLLMRNEGHHNLFEDVGTQVSIIREVSVTDLIGFNGRWGSMAVIQFLKM